MQSDNGSKRLTGLSSKPNSKPFANPFAKPWTHIYSADSIRSLDQTTIDLGIPGIVLMESAGSRVAHFIAETCSVIAYPRVLVLSGTGGNGGDGFVCGRYLAQLGYQVSICTPLGPPKGDAAVFWKSLGSTRVETLAETPKDFSDYSILVDALYGIGARQPLPEKAQQLIQRINLSKAKVFSVDLPSGLESDSWKLYESSVQADHTISLGSLKTCFGGYPARGQAGTLHSIDIGILDAAYKKAGSISSPIDLNLGYSFFPARQPDTHKTKLGHAVIVGGAPGTSGAPVLAARAALRAGAGLVTLIVPAENSLEGCPPEIMTIRLEKENGGYFTKKSAQTVFEKLGYRTVQSLAIGMGLRENAEDFVRTLIGQATCPLVLDAEAIAAWNSSIACEQPVVLTPHPGEFRRYLHAEDLTEQRAPFELLAKLSKQQKATIVYKSAMTTIAYPDQSTVFLQDTTAGLATAGSGDVLAGILAGTLAQHSYCKEAVAAAVSLHALAGKKAAKNHGEISMAASDIIESIALDGHSAQPID